MTENVALADSEAENSAEEALPCALVSGKPLTEMPENLYIPPDALEVILDTFEGPLDLLLYLIRKQNLDILEIPIADITAQYMQYIEMMQGLKLELAAEYLLMAALLAEIKSRMLLPRRESVEDEEDPRAELVRRLQEYERFRQAAQDLDELPRQQRDVFPLEIKPVITEQTKPLPEVELQALLMAFQGVLQRAKIHSSHQIQRESLSLRERMSNILLSLQGVEFREFNDFFNAEEGRSGVVVSFLAVLELMKSQLISIVQSEPFAPIYVQASLADVTDDEADNAF